ncbi:MAG TPA: MarR family winged helix-turn-helix transcriptional regulator [Thermoleophilaceae bacterium]|nr:MarR family winged helix-turn-helix transcriptional regulator [Thermoleophilaceae bacterium]
MGAPTSPGGRQPIGQLLSFHIRFFRERLLADAEEEAHRAGVSLRMAHLHVFGNISAEGTRLTDLAAWAGMGLPAMAELVDEMEGDGLLVRRPDPSDGRAKLVTLTPAGWDAIRTGRAIIARIEGEYARRLGSERYEQMCWALQDLLEDLAGAPMRRAEDPA